ncbi:universal stress protein [Paraburkholderia diazotrophica]|uniref:universal stress protein n=1 Tax=Paraburkholderia diazotrophica TaxID=667676 RepID=UPI003171F6B7
MFKHILLPIDGSDVSRRAVSSAIEFARISGARLTPYTCVQDQWIPTDNELWPEYASRVQDEARAEHAKIEEAAAQNGVHCIGATSAASSPYLGIIAKAMELECDVIFMASDGRNRVSSLLLGSETQKVLSHSTIPVLVFR